MYDETPGAKRKRATIIDVGRLAGVSWKTVSRVVNRDPSVRRDTLEKVQKAIAALNFEPNQAARSLVSSRSFLIGAITRNLSPHYVSELHRGAARACLRHNYHLVLEEIPENPRDWATPLEGNLRRMNFDGVLLAPPITDDDALLEILERNHVRYVRIAPATDIGRSDAIFADEAAGVAALTRHLWELGHRKLAIVEGPSGHYASPVRLQSFLDEVARLGGDPNRVDRERGDFTFETGRKAAQRLLGKSDPPTAIFATNDTSAAGVLAAAGEMGVRVPQQLSVVGFDDSEIASYVWPSLTTVRQSIAELARIAVEMLINPRTEEAPQVIRNPVELIKRHSTAPRAV